MDGKHIMIRPPPNSGSYYYNYKHNFSIVLLAIVDANYRFLYVDVGCNGRVSDGGVFGHCSLYQELDSNNLNIPTSKQLPGVSDELPLVLVADDAFPLKSYILKPYSLTGLTVQKRVFNYRLSRARRIVENAFGILANRFRVFMTHINLIPEKVEDIILASCALHNMLRMREEARDVYTPPGSLDVEDKVTHTVHLGEWRRDPVSTTLVPLSKQGSNRYSRAAKDIRDKFCDYFNSDAGKVPWQWKMI